MNEFHLLFGVQLFVLLVIWMSFATVITLKNKSPREIKGGGTIKSLVWFLGGLAGLIVCLFGMIKFHGLQNGVLTWWAFLMVGVLGSLFVSSQVLALINLAPFILGESPNLETDPVILSSGMSNSNEQV